MRKLIVASEYIDSSQNSTGYFWSKIILKLQSVGENVEVISPRRFNKYESFHNKTNIFRRIFKQIYVAMSLTGKILIKANSKSVLFTGTNPSVLLALMPILRHLFKFKWVLLVHDVFPENLVAAGVVGLDNKFYKIISRYFSWTYNSADLLICIGRDMQEVLLAKTGGRAKTIFIPNWVEENEVFPMPRSEVEIFEKYRWKDKLVFQFFGNIGRVQGIENILSAITLSRSNNAAFLFIGGGASVPLLKSFIEMHPEKNIKYLGPIPLDKKNMGLAMCDVALVTLEGGMFGLGVPSKAYFSLAAGKPILGVVDERSEIARMIDEHPIGWHCKPNAAQNLASLIDEICGAPEEIMKKNSRNVFLANYTENIVLSKIATCIRGFTDN